MKRALGVLLLGGILIAATPTMFGGWSVVTLLDVPEYLEVGKTTTISFKIRQHGQTIRFDRSPALTMHAADAGFLSRMFKRDRARAEKTASHGVYEATITPNTAGEVMLTIDTDLHGWKVPLLPMPVVEAGRTPPVLSPYERGRQLFVAKGCVGCHEKIDDPMLVGMVTVKAGPDLTGRNFPRDYLVMKIKNPAENRTGTYNGVVMPQLELDVEEIEALVSFINAGLETDETDRW